MGMLSEFKEFAMRGNVMDLAVGVIIGAILEVGRGVVGMVAGSRERGGAVGRCR